MKAFTRTCTTFRYFRPAAFSAGISDLKFQIADNTLRRDMKRNVIFSLLILAVVATAQARPQAPVAYNAFDGIQPGAHALGMGLAAVAVGGDVADVYYNPAGLVSLKSDNILGLSFDAARQSELSSDQLFSQDTLKDTNITMLSLCNAKGALSWRPIANYTSTSTTAGGWANTDVHIDAFTLSATQTDGKLVNGLNISYLYGRIGQASIEDNVPSAIIANGNGFSIGYGLLYNVSPSLRLGLSPNNICAFMWWDDYEAQQLPFSFRTGAACALSKTATFAYDFEKEYYRDSSPELTQNHFGLEQGLGDSLKIRLGIYGPDMNDLEVTHYTAGLGYGANNMNFDISGEKYRLDESDVYRIVIGVQIPL
jgi:hypothetical protein